jgi:hypothetical protein
LAWGAVGPPQLTRFIIGLIQVARIHTFNVLH